MRIAAPAAAPAGSHLDPVASASLRARFPSLPLVMDGDRMRSFLQASLFEGHGYVVEQCGRPKADLADGVCRVQYELLVRTPDDVVRDVIVVGTMFGEADAAVDRERNVLAPLAARAAPSFARTSVIERLAMAVSMFPVSDMLPTLPIVTDPNRMNEVLSSLLPSRSDVYLAAIELVRLRRTPRCVLRYRFAPGGPAALYGKVGSTAGVAHVRRGLHELRAALPESLRVPTMVGHVPELDLAVFEGLPGSRADLTAAAERSAVVEAAAVAAASLHTSRVTVGPLVTAESRVLRARQAAAGIEGDAAALTRWLTAIVDEVAERMRGTGAAAPVCAHGDFTLSQLLLDGGRAGILDFDGLCRAEPEYDLGRFVCYLRVALAKAGVPDADELTYRFLDSYRDRGGPSVSPARVRLESILSLVLMAVRSWQVLKPARLRLVCDVLAQEIGRW